MDAQLESARGVCGVMVCCSLQFLLVTGSRLSYFKWGGAHEELRWGSQVAGTTTESDKLRLPVNQANNFPDINLVKPN